MPSASAKRALVIGVDRYVNLSTFDQLRGCVNDARAMAGLLREQFGFDDVTLLLDEEATQRGIRDALEALAGAVAPGDTVVLFFAGHGSQIRDLEGDEPDGFDETIVPCDTGRPGLGADDTDAENRDITDDELHDWILRVSDVTPNVTLLFDCCHSGTVARDAFGAKARYLAPDERSAEELLRTRSPFEPRAAGPTRGVRGEAGPSGWLPLDKRYVLIAGCRDDECSYEYTDPQTGTHHGALTYFLIGALRDARPRTTYRDVYEQVRPAVTAYRGQQHPQMEGALDRFVFDTEEVRPMRFVTVEQRDEGGLTLGAGAAHGLTVGSEWEVYPPGTKEADGSEALGRVRVIRVGAVASEAQIQEEPEPWSIAPGARAVEVAHAFADPGFRIELRIPDAHADAAQALTTLIEQSGLLRLVAPGEDADARVYLLPPRPAAAEGDPVPQLGGLTAPTWAVVGTDGRLLMPPRAVSTIGDEQAGASEGAARARRAQIEKGARTLRDNFHKIAHYRRALALQNPAVDSALDGMIAVSLKRQEADGRWVEAEPEEAGGEVVIEEGERIAFSITNYHTEPVYVYAFDFGLTHRVNLLTMPGANEALAPGATLDVDALGRRREEKGIKLTFPTDFPFAHDPADPAPTEGTETLKVFATTEPTDFTSMEQEPTRSAGGAPADPRSLGQILRHTFQGVPMRDMDDTGEDAGGGDWTTVSRTFVLRRPAATSTALDAEGERVVLDGITLRTRGLEGEARVLPPPAFSARTRSAAPTTNALDAVLAEEHVGTQRSIEIQGARTRSLGAAPPTIEVEVPDPGPEAGQFVLYTDESGVTSWQFAEPGGGATRSLGPPMRRYVIDRAAPAPPPEGERTRGLVGAVGKKLLQVLVFPLVDPILGAVSEAFAERWEAAKRPYGLRPFTPDDYTTPSAPPLGGEDWRRLGAGRSLLFVHGTFSRAHSAFGGLGRDALAELHRRYDGRVFAFDHFTLSHDPRRNVEWFVRHLPDDARLDLDIVCHSRGGLVSRMLAEKQSAFSLGARSVRVGNVVFVASPNAGTHLADPEHMGALVNTYTNLLNLLPDNPVTDVLDGVVTVAKMIAVGALGGLKGLQSMRPGGEFQQWLNSPNGSTDVTYYALGADYTPRQSGFRDWVKDRLMDRVFGAENDLVVPTASVYEANGSGLFPIEERHVFPASDAIPHTGFFQHHAAQERLLTWLQA